MNFLRDWRIWWEYATMTADEYERHLDAIIEGILDRAV